MLTLYKDYWKGVLNFDEKIENPCWNEIKFAISELNQKERTHVCLQCDDLSNISIGGGNNKYHVYITTPDEKFFVLKDPEKSHLKSFESIVVGGQLGEYLSHSIVSLSLALKAAKSYFEFGEKEDSLFWTEE